MDIHRLAWLQIKRFIFHSLWDEENEIIRNAFFKKFQIIRLNHDPVDDRYKIMVACDDLEPVGDIDKLPVIDAVFNEVRDDVGHIKSVEIGIDVTAPAGTFDRDSI